MKAKLFPLSILMLWVTFINNPASAQTIFWKSQIGGIENDSGRAGCCDNEGNFYFAGMFWSPTCYFETTSLVRKGINDLFLIKYNPSGIVLWVHQIGGENEYSDETIAVYFDSTSNSIFISGSFSGTVNFDSCTLTANGGLDIFLVKFDLNGNCKWAKQAGGGSDDECYRLAFDNTGNLYMCGTTLSSSFNGFIIPKGGFLAKFDQDGTCLWAKNKFAWDPAFNSQIRPGGLKIWESDIFIGGCMGVDATIAIDTIVIAHKGFGSSLICCFDSTGTAKWIREGVCRITESISDIAIDAQGNIFHTGYFKDSINFNGNIITSSPGKREMFLVKYDKRGNSNGHGRHAEALIFRGSTLQIQETAI